MNKLFTSRPSVEVNPQDPPEFYAPQAVVVKGVRADGTFYKVDVGRLCYLDRVEVAPNAPGRKSQTLGLVNVDSLSPERVIWFKNYLENAFRRGWRDETLLGRLHCVRYFFQFCDFNGGTKPTTLIDLVQEYKRYYMVLDQRGRMSGDLALGTTALNGRLKSARDFVQWAFQFSSREILEYIPKFRHRTPKMALEGRSVSLEDGQNYLRACATYFVQFSDAILDNKYPVRVTPPNFSGDELYWHSPRGTTLKSLPDCFDKNGNPLPLKQIIHIIAKNFKSQVWNSDKHGFYNRTLIFNRNEWRKGSLTHQKVYAFNLSAFCFLQIYLGFTAANIQTALNLKMSDIDINNIGSSSFANKHKFRAGRSVEFTAPSHLKKELLRYLKLREWAESIGLSGDVGDYLFVKIGGDLSLKRLDRSCGLWLIKCSPLFQGIPLVSSREIRQIAGEYFVRKSKGKISLVAKKLNNSIATTAKSYTAIDLESQAIEMNDFHEALSSKVRNFNRVTDDPVSVRLASDCNTERIAVGSCSNVDGDAPIRKMDFNSKAPEPACGTFESCLFCEYFAVHTDFEDMHKLLSLREALRATSLVRNDPEHHEAVVQPAIFRIEEIIGYISDRDSGAREAVCKAEEEISMGRYNIHWSKQIQVMSSRINDLSLR